MALSASIPGHAECAGSPAYHPASFQVFACGQRPLHDTIDSADRDLTFWYSKKLDWHLHLFGESNSKPLPFSVVARLSIEEPGGEALDKSLPHRFRVTGTVTLPQRECHLLRYGHRIPILGWEIRLLATESVKIFSYLASTGDNTGTLAEPEPISLHTTAYRLLQGDKVTIPISWEGLQFHLPAYKNEKDRNDPVGSFFVCLQVKATTLSSQKVTASQARAGPFVIRHASKCIPSRPLAEPLGGTARLTSPPEAHTTFSETNHGRSLPDVSSSQLNLLSQAKDTALPENNATKPAVSPTPHRRKSCRWSPYSSSTTSIFQQQAHRGILRSVHQKSRGLLSDSGDDTR